MGSKKAVIIAPVDNIANVGETPTILTELKKAIQCEAIKKPASIKLGILFELILVIPELKKSIKMNKIIEAKIILYQTIVTASQLINAPMMDVKPKMKTIK